MGYVYFISEPNLERIKIGFSADPKSRLQQLQTGTPYELTMLGYVEGDFFHESHLHRHLSDFRVQGEWFDAVEKVQIIVDNIIEGRVLIKDLLVDGMALHLPIDVPQEDVPKVSLSVKTPEPLSKKPQKKNFIDRCEKNDFRFVQYVDEPCHNSLPKIVKTGGFDRLYSRTAMSPYWPALLLDYSGIVKKYGVRPKNLRFDIDPKSPLPVIMRETPSFFNDFKAFLYDFSRDPYGFGRPI